MAKSHFSATRNVDLGDYLDEEVYPRLYDRLDTAFPEFGFHPNGKSWVATQWPAGFPMSVGDPRPDRLQVYSDRPWWIKCHGHDGIRWLEYVNQGHRPSGTEFIEVFRILCEKAGVEFPERERSPEEQEHLRRQENRRSVLAVVTQHLQETLWDGQEDSQKALSYLWERGFTNEEVKSLGLGYYRSVSEVRQRLRSSGYNPQDPEDRQALDDAGVLWDKLEGYLFIPWNDATGHPLTLYGRWQEKDPPEGRLKTIALPGDGTKSSPLYFDRARQAGHKDLVAVEGVFDAAILQVRGDTRVVGYVAAQFSGLQVETLKRYKIESVVVCPDPDEGGDNGFRSSVRSLWEAGIIPYGAPRLPDGLDPDEFLLKYGLDGWQDHVNQAVPGLVYVAQTLLGDVTTQTPSRKAEKVIREVGQEMRGLLSGEEKERPRNEVLRLVADRTGWTIKELAPYFGLSLADVSSLRESEQEDQAAIVIAAANRASEERKQARKEEILDLESCIPQTGFIREYVNLYNPITEAPLLFTFAGGLAVLSAAVGREVWHEYGSPPLRCNLWVLAVAESGSMRKSGILGNARDTLQRLGERGGGDADYWKYLLPMPETRSGFANWAERKDGPRGLVLSEEYGGFLKVAEQLTYQSGIPEILTEIYSCETRPFSFRTDNLKFTLTNPYPCLLACTTRVWLRKGMTEGNTKSGFLYRHLIIPAKLDPHIQPIAFPPRPNQVLMENVDEHLWECSQAAGEAVLTKEARVYYEDWYGTRFREFLNTPEDEHANSLFRKHAAIALKVAILFEISVTRSREVSEKSVVLAVNLMDHLNFLMRRFLAEEQTNSRERDLMERVLSILREAGTQGMMKGDLQRGARTTAMLLKMALESLVEEGSVGFVPVPTGPKGGAPGSRWYAITK